MDFDTGLGMLAFIVPLAFISACFSKDPVGNFTGTIFAWLIFIYIFGK